MDENKEKAPSIYEMSIHQRIKISEFCDLLRVHGGWIYVFYSFSNAKESGHRDVWINNTIFIKDDTNKKNK